MTDLSLSQGRPGVPGEPVLDRFFVEVLVMAEDPNVRRNRIALLQAIGRAVSRTARLIEVVVDKAEARAKVGGVGPGNRQGRATYRRRSPVRPMLSSRT